MTKNEERVKYLEDEINQKKMYYSAIGDRLNEDETRQLFTERKKLEKELESLKNGTNWTNLKEFLKVVNNHLDDLACDCEDQDEYESDVLDTLREFVWDEEVASKYHLLLGDADFCRKFLDYKVDDIDEHNDDLEETFRDFILDYLMDYFKDKPKERFIEEEGE